MLKLTVEGDEFALRVVARAFGPIDLQDHLAHRMLNGLRSGL